MYLKIWDVVCVAVLLIILTLGLWPFHAPRNNVTWLADRNGLFFGGDGAAFGSDALGAAGQFDGGGASIELWVQPAKVWDNGTLLTLYRREDSFQFSLYQSLTDLGLGSGTARFIVADVFRKGSAVFITLSSSAEGTSIYIDGVPVRTARGLQLSAADLASRIIAGDSVGQDRSWKGKLMGLAFYREPLTGEQVVRHYAGWKKAGRPELTAEDRSAALYLFDEHRGNAAHSQIGSGILSIPETYTVLDKVRLEPIWEEFEISRSYWRAAEKNIVGFIPFGFCFFGYWSVARPVRKAALRTIVLGTAVSFTIEFLQSYLPTRDSGMTDLVTNTLGTALGVLLYRTKLAQSAMQWVFEKAANSPVSRVM